MKVLVHKFVTGAILGKAGAIIREIQESTGCHVSLSVECVGDSTEKTASLKGTTEAFAACVRRILTQLQDNLPKVGSILVNYEPERVSVNPYGAPVAISYGAPAYSPYAATPPKSTYGEFLGGASASPYGSYGIPPAYGASAGVPMGATSTEKIVIPTVCSGMVIGKGGKIIADIKVKSQTNISIADATPAAPNDRVVTITGAFAGIQHAIMLVGTLTHCLPLSLTISHYLLLCLTVSTQSQLLTQKQTQIKHCVDSYDPSHVAGAGPPRGAGMSISGPGMQMGGAKAEEKIVIPTQCSGMVIGKAGSIINNIKMQSQTNITIADAAAAVNRPLMLCLAYFAVVHHPCCWLSLCSVFCFCWFLTLASPWSLGAQRSRGDYLWCTRRHPARHHAGQQKTHSLTHSLTRTHAHMRTCTHTHTHTLTHANANANADQTMCGLL
jgi:rRNA processing protein Krr1/Pno1